MADIVAAAKARTEAKNQPRTELAKLERAVSSAEMRVQKAQDKQMLQAKTQKLMTKLKS